MKRIAPLRIAPLLVIALTLGVLSAATVAATAAPATSTTYRLPPTGQDQWFWDIGGGKLPATTGAYPAPGSANIWDTDDFDDATTLGANNEPNAPSSIVTSLHASGKYSICYIEAGAQQPEPDSSQFAAADYTNGSPSTTQMQGYSSEYWFDLRGFAGYRYGDPDSALTGAAPNIAAGLSNRIAGCAAEGQDAIEPDDLDGYTNDSASGAAGGGWGLTQADAAGFEAWLAYTAHSDGLAIFQKNDGANSTVDEPYFDGMIIEECNYYQDPCSGPGGDATAYLKAGKPVLNAEYTDDGETTAKFCSADIAAGITGALFNVDLDDQTYEPCAPVGSTSGGGTGTTTGTTSTTTTITPPPVTSTTVTTTTTSSSTPTQTTTTTAPPSPPVNVRLPAITGTPQQGDELHATTGVWSNATRYTYAWLKCAKSCRTVSGATGSAYQVGSGAVGDRLQVTVTAHNADGVTSATSAKTAVVTAAKQHSRARSRTRANSQPARSRRRR